MYLKSIKALGFKSFADSINIELEPGITGVVGPNGSGKSNIVDAVRWVLGEQSLKALRGTKEMSDIIFSGSKSRKPMTRAYVSLTFDNSDHYLNTDFENVEIKRVVYKTGENDYFINNAKVRLKDITDLFIDSGASKESFNIISQGAVGDIISSKNEDRRVIIESAAGVLKYKKRKEETNRKQVKVEDNLEKINLVINELKDNHEILETQAARARKYIEKKQRLEQVEVALMAVEIKELSEKYNQSKEEIKVLQEDLENRDISNTKNNAKLEDLKITSLKIEETITFLREQVMVLTKEISDLNSQKQLTIERKKYEIDSNLIQSNILALKEEILIMNKNIDGLKKEMMILKENIEKKEMTYATKIKEFQQKSLEKVNCNSNIDTLAKKIMQLDNKIEICETNIATDSKMPYAVKAILNNPRLEGICGIIGKLIEVEEKYALAIDTSLGYASNIIVVNDETKAKEAINYLKTNKLGRATFFPLNIIKEKKVDETTLKALKEVKGYIGLAVDLVKFETKYKNIIANQLGNVIVVDSIDTLNKVGKIINYRYKVVSLDGEVLHTGGAIAGGIAKVSASSVIMEKDNLNKFLKEKKQCEQELAGFKTKFSVMEKRVLESEDEVQILNQECILLKEQLNRKRISLSDLEQTLKTKTLELQGTTNLKEQKLDEELDNLLKDYYEKVSKKESLEQDLEKALLEKNDILLQIGELEKNSKEKNATYNKKLQELKEKEISLGKMDVRLDNLLKSLSETYNMTYEKASLYTLDVSIDEALSLVTDLKRDLHNLGNVNLGAIEEFKRVNQRYTFLVNQKEDLESSIVNLQKAIVQMDEIMQQKFLDTFLKIEEEFNKVFKKLFKGGEGHLKLTDPDNLLETGVAISALPPGKKLNSIELLSGGEKTLTAIALLFAILNVKSVPFVILDEVEAALDEVNVETFGKYLQEKKEKSQFIIITHKKKTMEYADILYGITMQESGISKLVSVKLENL